MAIQATQHLTGTGSTVRTRVDPEFATVSLVRISGTWTGTLQVMGSQSLDGSSPDFAIAGVNLATGEIVTDITANGVYRFDTAGCGSMLVSAAAGFLGDAAVDVSTVIG